MAKTRAEKLSDIIEASKTLRNRPQEFKRFLAGQMLEEGQCGQCGNTVEPAERFCSNCGRLNPGFDPADFKRFFETSIEQMVQTDCLTHEGQESNFCMSCGVQLNLDAEPAGSPPRAN